MMDQKLVKGSTDNESLGWFDLGLLIGFIMAYCYLSHFKSDFDSVK